jgi:hypothetical protein
MGKGPRNYSELTIKRLYALSDNKCAFPGCPVVFTNPTNTTNFSNICHIEDAEEGGRFNPNMTDKQRSSFENLILLCPNHHIETNDADKFTVDSLREMKQKHESLSISKGLAKNPSMLKNAINAISNLTLDAISESENLNVYNPKQKLSYNSVKTNYSLIQDYKIYQGKINNLYDELERQGSIKKEKLLSNINQIYIKIKGKYVLDSDNPLEIIRLNSDNILNDVADDLYIKLENSNLFDEDIILGIKLILVDAFIRCKILEEPVENDSK